MFFPVLRPNVDKDPGKSEEGVGDFGGGVRGFSRGAWRGACQNLFSVFEKPICGVRSREGRR